VTNERITSTTNAEVCVRRPFRFAVFAYDAASRRDWEEKARRAEALGYAVLVMPDHFVNPLTPVPALAAAAAATTTLRIGAIVFANDYRHPALLAKEAATLDLLSDGRFEFGLGAGWHQEEYERAGIRFDPPGQRIARMREALTICKGLWAEGPLTFQGAHYAITGLDGTPKPVQKPHPPLFVGGTGPRMLRLAGREADIVGFIPQTLPRGGHDWIASTPELLDRQIGWVREGAGDRFEQLELSMVAFRAIVTDCPHDAAVEVARDYALTPHQVLASPDFLIGTEDAIVERLLSGRERFGISYLEIDDRDAAGFATVVARLAGR
jgi:probable F420-dependent oxidoreductase